MVNYVIWFIKNPDIQLIKLSLEAFIPQSNKSNYINLEFHSMHPLQLRYKQGTPNFQHYKVFHENFFKTRTHYNYTITIYLSLPKGTPSYWKI